MVKILKFGLILLIVNACASNKKMQDRIVLNDDFKNYWFQNGAEITSFKLNQNRYGEKREGQLVHVFVTEPFDPIQLVKPDIKKAKDVNVLKLNSIKKFQTGIYDYSIMSSIFHNLNFDSKALKISFSSQEWCGHVYMEMKQENKTKKVNIDSYFESEVNQEFKLKDCLFEDELYTQIRLNPINLPFDEIEIVPSFEFLRLEHIPLKKSKAEAKLEKSVHFSTYTIYYPEYQRTVKIIFQSKFPYNIVKIEENYTNRMNKIVENIAVKDTSIRLKYWEKNKNIDSIYQNILKLK